MTPLQKIAMGLLVVVVQAELAPGWDGLANPVGWALVIWGVWSGRDHLVPQVSLLALSGLAFLVDLVTYPPAVQDSIAPSGGFLDLPGDEVALVQDELSSLWLLSLPDLAFVIVLVTAILRALDRRHRGLSVLRWLLPVTAVALPAALAADSPIGVALAQAVYQLEQIALVWMLFSVSRSPSLGGWPRPIRLPRPRDEAESDISPPHHDENGRGSLS